jgi:hypothetical protein
MAEAILPRMFRVVSVNGPRREMPVSGRDRCDLTFLHAHRVAARTTAYNQKDATDMARHYLERAWGRFSRCPHRF